MIDPLGEQGNLNIRRAGIFVVHAELFNHLCLGFHVFQYQKIKLNKTGSLGQSGVGVKRFIGGIWRLRRGSGKNFKLQIISNIPKSRGFLVQISRAIAGGTRVSAGSSSKPGGRAS